MSLQSLSEWLRCPNCFLPLQHRGSLILGCPTGHQFDVNKRGYVTLLSGRQKFIADSAVMLDARDRFQGGGFYAPLRDAVSHLVATERPRALVDVGCGSGYYLQGVLAACEAAANTDPPRALAVDLSPTAVARSLRTARLPSRPDAHLDGLVADVWAPLAIRDGAAQVVLNIFAPRNVHEFHRVLTPGGLLVVVVPQETHLQELRAAGLAVSMQPDKARHLINGLSTHFSLEHRNQLMSHLELSHDDVQAVLGMGPSAHHAGAQALSAVEVPVSVTAAFDIFSFRRRPM